MKLPIDGRRNVTDGHKWASLWLGYETYQPYDLPLDLLPLTLRLWFREDADRLAYQRIAKLGTVPHV